MTWVVERKSKELGFVMHYHSGGVREREFATPEQARDFIDSLADRQFDPMDYTWRIRPFEMDSSNAHLQQFYGKLPDPPPAKYKVVIEVLGGVAYVEECPPEVEVEIIDYDNENDEDGFEVL